MNYAVVMAGGSGTRFWPVSRAHLPKQLLPIFGDDVLLVQTMKRLEPLLPPERVLIVTGVAIADKISRALPGLPAANLIAEPLRRNTAPCAAVAAKLLADRDPDAVLALLPADHTIRRPEVFREVLAAACQLAAREEVLITLGIAPDFPETGYGYIEMADRLGRENGQPYHRVAAFHEKPRAERAQAFLAAGSFLWNSGIFFFRAATFLAAVQEHLPDLWARIADLSGTEPPAEIERRLEEIYPRIEGVSIDVGVMEKVDNLVVFPADIGWSDVGSWTAIRELHPADENHNVAHGDAVILDGANNTVFACDGVVVALGVDDLIVVHTPDATLVARRDDAQAVKKVFDELERRGLTKYL
ncbi:MAG: NTP transferase domain-containing protein [Myxococcales bacterium]|nr:NTP transferase domain-containing protein [Myxococcales bacterium]